MKYFFDTEFIEGFQKPLFSKRRHFIDLISIGIVAEDGREYHAISNEYKYNDADDWVKENVIIPLYTNTVHGDKRNWCSADNFQKAFGKTNKQIAEEIVMFCYPEQSKNFKGAETEFFQRSKEYGWNEPHPEFYAYYADYDWVVFCSLFGRMIDLPKGFPMYCKDLKQMLDESLMMQYPVNDTTVNEYPKQLNEHTALDDAKWNFKLFEFVQKCRV